MREGRCHHCSNHARGLRVEKGETVTVLLMESGWGWATNESGQSGWVPLGGLEALLSE